jgi:hypothetical protein
MNTSAKTKKNSVYLLVAALVFLAILAVVAIMDAQSRIQSIDNFDDCVAAGYPVQESYPERCTTSDGHSFVNERQSLQPVHF